MPETPDSPPPTPAWVKALIVVLAVLVVAAIAHFLLGGGGHGPGMHG
ncbi:hypothetical protein [Nocardioides sp.]|nr:hypothetical protein [Nocardioides sp.]HSX67410.1 hypothetical protein [Nocardioides sp.]